MARSFSQEPRSDSHKIGETRYRMSHLPSTTAIARTLLLAGILLAVTVLATQSFLPAFAQQTPDMDDSDEKIEGYPENSKDPVIAFTATDPEGTQVTWSLGGVDAADFDLTDGVLTFESPPDYESPTGRTDTSTTESRNVYVVQVVATDADNDTHTVTVTVTVTNVEESGVIGTEGLEHPNAGVQITASLTDPDWVTDSNTSGTPPEDPAPTWQWATSTSATGPWNDIDTASAKTKDYTPRDSDVDSYLRVTATYHDVTTRDDATTPDVDESEDKAHKVFSTTVEPSGEDRPPAFPVQDPDAADAADRTAQERRVSENATVDTDVGDPVVANTDNLADGSPDTLSYSLLDDDDDTNVPNRDPANDDDEFFKIDSATGQISVKKEGLNYEATVPTGDKKYDLIVRATDTSGQSTTTKVAIEVIDLREDPKIGDENADSAPTTNDNLTARSVTEGTDTSITVLSTYAATDDEDESANLKWSLEGNDKGRFKLSANTGATVELTFREDPDFEDLSSAQKRNGLKLKVTVEDSHGQTDSRDVTVTVENVDEEGTVTLARVQGQVGTPITATLTDPDGTPSSVKWQWAKSANPNGSSPGERTQPSTSSSYTPVASDEGDFLVVFASYTDPQGADKTAEEVTTARVKVKNEYCTAASQRNAGQPDAHFLCTSVTSGNNAPMFPDQDLGTQGPQNTIDVSVDENTASGENIGIAPITATDNTNTACINLRDIYGCHNMRNSATGTEVALLATTNNVADTLTYTLEGTDAKSFAIDPNSGRLMTKVALDYESKKSYSVTVNATDPSGTSASSNNRVRVTINVDPEEESPKITGGATTIRVAENTATTTILSTYTATDDEDDKAKKALKWSVEPQSIFSIEGGQLKFKQSPNFESLAADDVTRTVTVTVADSADSGSTPATQPVSVTVIDVDETGSIQPVINVNGVESEVQRPRSGTEITAKLTDPDWATSTDTDDEIEVPADTAPAQLTWQWATSTSANGPWNDIDGATSNTYKPSDSDVGSYLRVTATYVDGTTEDDTTTPDVDEREDKLPKVFTVTVLPSTENKPPVFPVQDPDAPDAAARTAQERRVTENAKVNDLVGAPVVATDIRPDGRQDRLVYSLLDDDDDTNVPNRDGPDNDDDEFFKINSATGQISVKKEGLDYEATNPADAETDPGDKTYNVLVKATDTSMASTTVKVEIRVVDVREAPEIDDENADNDSDTDDNLATKSVPEKNTATSTVLSTYAAEDDEDDSPTPSASKWSLEGADKDMFVLCKENAVETCTDSTSDTDDSDNDNTVSLRFKEIPNFEARSNSVYRVTVVATDSDGQTASRNVAVTVTNIEEDGEVILSSVQPEVGTPITATLSDPDGGESGITWQWQSQEDTSRDALNDADTAWPDIRGATSRSYTPVADDVSSDPTNTGIFLRATAEYTDNFRPEDNPNTNDDESQEKDNADGTTSYHPVLATVDGNRSPAFGDQDPNTDGIQDTQATRRVNENSGQYTTVGIPVTAVDHDPGELTYTLEGTDAGLFTIDMVLDDVDDDTVPATTSPGQIRVGKGTKLDYETRTSYRVTVRATDPAGASDTIAVNIEVIALNEAPEVSAKGLVVSGAASVSYAEDRDDAVETYTARGDEAAGASWSLAGDDSSAFSIAGGELSFSSQPDFEAPADDGTDNVYNVTVRAVGATISATRSVTVTVTNVDEDGTATITPSGQPRVGVELTASLTDIDGTPTAVSWQWSRSTSNTGGWSNIAGGRQANYTPTVADEDNYLRATASYTDPQGSGKSESAVTSAAVLAASTEGTPGTVALTPSTQLTSGDSVTATLTDADNPVNHAWLWQRSVDGGSTNWTTISTATSATYTTTNADAGNYLRASVTYRDDSGAGQTAGPTATANRVRIDSYDDDSNGVINGTEVLNAVRDYFAGNLTPARVLDVVRLYFAGLN